MVNRISGLASGIDYETMITQLMTAKKAPVNKLNQQKQALEWKRDDYRTLNNKILEFRNMAFDMKLQSAYLSKKASSSDESIATVSGSAASNAGQYTVKIDNLAAAGSIHTGKLNGAATLGGLGFAAANTEFTIGGEKGTSTIAITQATTINEFVTAVNGKTSTTGVTASYDSTLDTLFFTSSKTGDASNISMSVKDGNAAALFGMNAADYTSGSLFTASKTFASTSTVIDSTIASTQKLDVDYGGDTYSVDITATTTIGDLAKQLNMKLKDAGVSVSVSAAGELSFLGAADVSDFAFSSSTGYDLSKVGLNAALNNSGNTTIRTNNGEDAEVLFNGVSGSYASNTFTISGLTITAKKEGTVNVSNTEDVDAVFDKIKNFVDKYNSLIETVNTEISEKRDRDFSPLTDEQREEMDEKEIEKWETKARAGTLSGDSILTRGLHNFRQALKDSISGLPSGQLSSLSEIGISNTLLSGTVISGDYSDKGKLYIDETKLKAALSEKPEEVVALFTTNTALSEGDGIATKLYDQAAALFTKITDKAGTSTSIESNYTMGKESLRIQTQIEKLNDRLEDLETRYYKQFSSMETYINQMNSQSAWLTQQFSS